MDWTDNNALYCSLDLETNENSEIFAIGAVLKDKTFQRKAPFDIRRALAELDDFAADADYLLGIGSEEAAASVCPQNRAYGSVHGSSCKAYPLRNFKPMCQLAVGSYFLSFQVNKPTVGVGSRHRSGV